MNSDKPAYPTLTERGKKIKGDSGITKREWMAGMAMQGLLAGIGLNNASHSDMRELHENVTPAAYRIADTMLKEDEKSEQDEK